MDNIKTLSNKQLLTRLFDLEEDYYRTENEDERMGIYKERKMIALERLLRRGKSETAARKLLNIQK